MHSLDANSLSWNHVIEDFARDRVVLMPEMIGVPGLSVQTAPIDENGFGTWFGEVLDGLGVDRVHVVGYSQGGWCRSDATTPGPDRHEEGDRGPDNRLRTSGWWTPWQCRAR
ncbi:hypothetical protein AB0H20_26450 [Nocardia fluminea]|uniref:alpha/beta fold hydrolase n=1 Tax=Nocardia fluminea TaxID=134984 RepID=UPI0033DB2A58